MPIIKTGGGSTFTLPASLLVAGGVAFSDGTTLVGDADNFYYDDANNRLGVGVGAQETTITINGTTYGSTLGVHSEGVGNVAELAMHRHSNTAGLGPFLVFARSRGTEAAETAVQNADILGGIYFVGHDGTDYAIGSQILATVSGTPGANDLPTKLGFYTTQDGASTPTLAMEIGPTQDTTFSGDILASSNAAFDIGNSTNRFRTLYMQNDGGRVLDLTDAATFGASTDYTMFVGGGDDGTGYTNNFTMLMGDCTSNINAFNTFSVDLGLCDSSGFAPNKFVVTSDTQASIGRVSFNVNIAGNNINPETGLSLTSAVGVAGVALIPSRFIFDNSTLPSGAFSSANFKTIDFRFDNTSFLKFDYTNAANAGFAVYDIPAHNKNVATYSRFRIANTNAINISTAGAKTLRSTLSLAEPNITVSAGSLTSACTLYVQDAPTEGTTNNFALWVDSGNSRFDGKIDHIPEAMSATASTSWGRFHSRPGGALTIPTGTTPIVAQGWFKEPNLTATGTITDAVTLYVEDAPTEGTRNYAFWVDSGLTRFDGDVVIGANAVSDSANLYVTGKLSTSGEVEINGALNHDGTTVGFYGTAPATQSATYSGITNVTPDRAYDANATTLDEVADVLGTLIADLRLTGIIG